VVLAVAHARRPRQPVRVFREQRGHVAVGEIDEAGAVATRDLRVPPALCRGRRGGKRRTEDDDGGAKRGRAQTFRVHRVSGTSVGEKNGECMKYGTYVNTASMLRI